jgi:parallel beta-helix repeat protein
LQLLAGHLSDRRQPPSKPQAVAGDALHVLRKPSLALAGVATALAVIAVSAAPASAATRCDRVASPGPGAAQQLVDSLEPGQVGCLHGGTYTGDVKVARPGITLTRFGSERATVKGRLWVARGADGVTVEGLFLDGTNRDTLPSPTVNADKATFRRNDVTNNHHSICFDLGHQEWGRADNTRIELNRIHDCGRLPATNHDHGIYVGIASNTLIRGNWIYDNADYGIQLYPSAQNTRVVGNVIDGNGEGITFSGEHGLTSNGNVVEGNVIANSKVRNNVESWYPRGNPIGRGNVVRNNCVKGGRYDYGNGGIGEQIGFRVEGTIRTRATYANRGAGDFRLAAGSACRLVMAAAYRGTVPGPEGLHEARATRVRRRPSAVIFGAVRPMVRPGHRVLVLGRVAQMRPGLHVTIFARSHGHRRRLARVAIRANGTFAVRPRVHAPRAARFVRVSAVVRGVGRSPSIRLRLHRR